MPSLFERENGARRGARGQGGLGTHAHKPRSLLPLACVKRRATTDPKQARVGVSLIRKTKAHSSLLPKNKSKMNVKKPVYIPLQTVSHTNFKWICPQNVACSSKLRFEAHHSLIHKTETMRFDHQWVNYADVVNTGDTQF